MTVKLTGADWNAFMQDKAEWPEGAYYQDEELHVNGDHMGNDGASDDLPLDAKVSVRGGEFYPSAKDREFYSFERKLRAWLKARTVTTVVLEVDNEELPYLKTMLTFITGVRLLK